MSTSVRQRGAAIRQLRRERGVKTGEMARRLDIHRNSLVNIENDAKPASWELLYSLSHALDVEITDLLSDAGRREREAVA